MLYVEWVQRVLDAMETCENDRTRLVGLPPAALRETLSVDLSDVDAIEDALCDLEMLGLARHRPADVYNLTALGRRAVAQSLESVCGTAINHTRTALTDEQRGFLRALVAFSQSEYDRFARMRYIAVDLVFDKIGMRGPHPQQEMFLLPLVESKCIDYREFVEGRDARPLFIGATCTSAAREHIDPAVPLEIPAREFTDGAR